MRIVDSFCGLGGSTLGATWAGHHPVAAINHWLIAALAYEANHGLAPIRQSIEDVDPADLPQADILLFSPECQSHSSARGARPRDEISRNTAMDVVRFVRAIRPLAWVVENVPAMRKWPRFGAWAAELEDLGYGINHDEKGRPGQVVDASEWGVPQSRRRLIVVGGRGYTPVLQSPGLAPIPVAECIDWSLPCGSVTRRERPLSENTLRRIEAGRAIYGDGAFLCQYNGTATTQPIDRPCRTLPTHDRFALVHGDRFRFLQPSEMLRIFGFPDTYRLAGNRAEQVMLLGNCVPPKLMQGVLEQVTP